MNGYEAPKHKSKFQYRKTYHVNPQNLPQAAVLPFLLSKYISYHTLRIYDVVFF